MQNKLKGFSRYLSQNKVFLGVFLSALVLILPSGAHAGIRAWAADLAQGLFAWGLGLGIGVVYFFTELAGGLLAWIISPGAISFSYTNPSGPNANPIIEAGLEVTKGFANIFLVLVLLYIAIATILKIKEYEAQKLLPIFVLVALLVNFAPVVTGVVVDASNIVMGFFVNSLEPDQFTDVLNTKVQGLKRAVVDAGFTMDEMQGPINQLIVVGIIMFILTLIFILFFFLFLGRYIAIWMLTIMSPLAFVAFILPKTRKYFIDWWQQLINWSFIGAIGGFFIYLSLSILLKLENDPGTISTGGSLVAQESAILDNILPLLVPIVFLVAGFIYSLKGSAAGSSILIKAAQWTNKKYASPYKGAAKRAWAAMNLGERKWLPRTISGKEREQYGKHIAQKGAVRRVASTVFKTKEERENTIPQRRWYNHKKWVGWTNPNRYLRTATPRDAATKIGQKLDKVPVVRAFKPKWMEEIYHYDAFKQAEEAKGPSPTVASNLRNGKLIGAKAVKAIYDLLNSREDSNDIIMEAAGTFKTYRDKNGKPQKYLDEKGNLSKEKEEILLNDKRFTHNKRWLAHREFGLQTGEWDKILRTDPRLAKIGQASPEDGDRAMAKIMTEIKPASYGKWEQEVPTNLAIAEQGMFLKGNPYYRRMVENIKGGEIVIPHAHNLAYSKWIDEENERRLQEKETELDPNTLEAQNAYEEYGKRKYGVEKMGLKGAVDENRLRSILTYGKWEGSDEARLVHYIHPDDRNKTPGRMPAGEALDIDVDVDVTPQTPTEGGPQPGAGEELTSGGIIVPKGTTTEMVRDRKEKAETGRQQQKEAQERQEYNTATTEQKITIINNTRREVGEKKLSNKEKRWMRKLIDNKFDDRKFDAAELIQMSKEELERNFKEIREKENNEKRYNRQQGKKTR